MGQSRDCYVCELVACVDGQVARPTAHDSAQLRREQPARAQRCPDQGDVPVMPLRQRAPTDRPAHTAAVQSESRPAVEVPTVAVSPAQPDAVVLAVRGEVDSCTSPLLRDRLLEHVRPACPQLVVDLTEVSFFGAAGLTVLVMAREAAEAAAVRLCLVAGTRVVLRPLMITGLDEVFDICPDIAHAQRRLDGVAVQNIDVSLDDDGLRRSYAGPGSPSTLIT